MEISNATEPPIDIGPPSHLGEDWEYFLKQSETPSPIALSYDKKDWNINSMYRMRISHIYDPSMFWVVHEENELNVLHQYLHNFYTKHKTHYKIPRKNYKLKMFCVTFTEGAFYRSILVELPYTIEKQSWAHAFLIDFGFVARVPFEEFYFMTTKMYGVPQFSIRACLSGMCPVDSPTWSPEVISKFNELACNKVLICQVTNKIDDQKMLFLKLGKYNCEKHCVDSINDILVCERLAKQMTVTDVREIKHANKKKRPHSQARLPFLHPIFNAIENSICPDTVLIARFFEEIISQELIP